MGIGAISRKVRLLALERIRFQAAAGSEAAEWEPGAAFRTRESAMGWATPYIAQLQEGREVGEERG